MKRKGNWIFLMLIFAFACGTGNNCNTKGPIHDGLLPRAENFKDTINGKPTDLYYLTNQSGMEAAITNYGGRLVGLVVPGKDGKPVDVVLGFGSLEGYLQTTEPYFGALIGRVGNRIAGGRFVLNGVEYNLPKNNGPNTLHGGLKGFQDVVWDATQTSDSTLVLKYFSSHGEEGFPGNLDVEVTYSLTPRIGLQIDYRAQTDRLTPVNLTNHAFFNLNGEGAGTINNHLLMINADYFTPVDSTLIPTGELRPVENTPFDYRTPVKIGERLDTTANFQLKYGKGYDHNFALIATDDDMPVVAQIKGDKSGIVMFVRTNEPGLQFYGGNFMQSQNKLKSGAKDDFRTAFCLETQHFPDAVNQPAFPSVLLDKDEDYHTVSEYVFYVKNEL
jgi:aldose 1-epimerase